MKLMPLNSFSNSTETVRPVVSVKGARKSFGTTDVLRGISFDVMPGEVLAIIGPSGGGKSTLLRCMALLEKLDSGSISFGDLQVATDNGSGSVYANKATIAAAKQRFRFVFQNFNLFPHWSALRNITDAPITVQKRPKADVEAEARVLIAQMGLEGTESKVPSELSGGQAQRVSIARALAMKPDVLFFDEPTSALDPKLTADVLRVIRDLAAQHMTMVIVTHEMNFARDVADHVIFMDGGTIVEQGSAAQVIEHPREDRTQAFLANN